MLAWMKRLVPAQVCWSVLVAALSIVGSSATWAQITEPQRTVAQLSHTAWTTRDGAPANIVALAQTTDGFLWLGASTGLFRFDGITFERFDGPAGQPLPAANISALLALPNGSLWIGYRFGGVSVFQGNRLTTYGEREGLPPGTVRALALDSAGTMWAGTHRGLARLDGGRWSVVGAENGITDIHVGSLLVDRRGALWAATDSSVFRLARGGRDFAIAYLHSLGLGESRLAEAASGSVWGSSLNGGLIQLSNETGGPPAARPPIGPAVTGPIAIDRESSIWYVATDGVGRVFLRKSADSPTVDDSTPARLPRSALSGNSAYVFLEDRERNVWVGTSGGLDRLRPTKLVPVALPTPLADPAITAGDSGVMWAASWSKPVFRVQHGYAQQSPGPVVIEAAFRDRHGVVWLGGPKGLWHLQGQGFVRDQLPDSLTGTYIQAIALDSADGLWVSAPGGKGVYRRFGGVWTQYANLPDLPRLSALTIVPDAAGRTWFGYTENRLALLDRGRVHVYTGADGLRVGTVLAVRPHGDRAYVGGEQGLMFFSGDRFLPIVGVGVDRFRGTSGIVETPTGDLWLHGADGITRITLEEVRRATRDTTYRVRFTRLDFRDGLDGAAPQIRPLPSVVEASDGRLWFVTGTGVTWLDPEHMLNNPVPPPVHIRSLTVGDTEYEPSRGVRLPTRTTALRIRYTALSLAIPERVRFRYQLVGSDTGWQDVGTRREAFYTNLRPGSYRFRVTASNDDGVWNESGASMDFVIPPTFLQTNAFLALCGLAVGGVAWMLYRLRVRQVAGAMRATFDATLAERTRIAQELHDTLLQGFTGITFHLQGLQRMITDRPGDAAESLARVLELAAATLRDARRTVSGMRMPDLESRDLPDALTTAARDTLAGTSIDFRFAVRGEPRQLTNDVEVTALRIGREAVINALKHANPQVVEMVLEYEPRSLTLHVRDDGRGLAAADASIAPHTGHWGIVGMRERATRVGGSLEISGAPDLGTVVSVSLPIGADH